MDTNKERESERFSYQRRRASQCRCCLRFYLTHTQTKLSQKRPVKRWHGLISPTKLHIFGDSRRHQKMRMGVIQGCANLWSIWMSSLRVLLATPQGACSERDLQKKNRWKSLYDTVFQTNPEDARDQLFRTFSTFEIRNWLLENWFVDEKFELFESANFCE